MSKPEWLKRCQKILITLMQHKHGWIFSEPVDPVKLGIPDYFDVIKHPMDLGTVKAQLSSGEIDTPEKFKDKVNLTFENAMKYNPKEHDVYLMGKTLSDLFKQKWEKDEEGITEKYRYDQAGGAQSGQQDTSTGKRLMDSEFKDDRPMTYDEKRALSINMNKLPGKKLGSVVQIIHDRNHKILQPNGDDQDEIEIDIDKIDNETLRYLEHFVNEALAKKNKKHKSA